ncbi:hypothetical protein COJ85_17840 [Bacillus sp. AFS076308]|uniref:anti-sigma factor family protein n=1 Tax=Bacillaceae TaxID=186817 RepID=UPI000BFA83CC|nr:zf-HC2 domain-containing protein [Bacillus sp. AFS076308]PFO01175.1 hypothetical protein COJ85_17840 [Bacillus sp. AFS076308]
MKHYSYEEWQHYVKDELSEDRREDLESHLYTCDQCLEVYLQAVTANETSLPALPDEPNFTDRVMEMGPFTNKNINNVEIVFSVPVTHSTFKGVEMVNSVPGTERKPLYQRAGFHYLLAAAATLLLMFSGAFQSLATYAGSLEKPMIQERKPKPSVTEGVINKTFAWMDSLEKKEANKK